MYTYITLSTAPLSIFLCLIRPDLPLSRFCQFSCSPILRLFVAFLFRCPCGLHFKTCIVMFMFSSLRACPIPSPYSLCFLMLTSTGWCLDILYKSTLLIVLGHLFFRMFLRHFLTNTWASFMDVDVSIQVSDP